VKKAHSSAVLSNPALLEAYTRSLSEAEVGPSGVAQVMATILNITDKDQYVKKMFVFNDFSVETQNSTKNVLK
jgi:hypothetical protein